MGDVLKMIWWVVTGLLRSRASLEAEIVALRHQLNVLRRKAPKRAAFNNFDRFVFGSLYRITPDVLNALVIVKPETVIRWHRAGFRLFWRWKSRSRVGRPKVALEIRQLIRDMSLANPFWGAPRIHGELLKLGINVGQTSVAKYMAKARENEPVEIAENNPLRRFSLQHNELVAKRQEKPGDQPPDQFGHIHHEAQHRPIRGFTLGG
jgi:hypothetical protein